MTKLKPSPVGPGRAASELWAHPLRQNALEEIHARPFAALRSPTRVAHFAFMSEDAADERESLKRWLTARWSNCGLTDETRHLQVSFPEGVFQWERHGEFTTYLFESGGKPSWPDDLTQPGPLVVAVALEVRQRVEGDATRLADIARTCVAQGRALLGSTFIANPAGFVEIEVVDQGLRPNEVGPLIQRILEVETYRTLALLGLPEAQRLAPMVRDIERELPQLMQTMRLNHDLHASQAMLDRLTELSADLEAGSAAAAYRFGASRAYAELMRLRLEALHEVSQDGDPTWSDFFARRLNPALRTCASTEDRQEALALKLERAGQLLRTQVEVRLQQQNRDLLRAMNRRARLQLQLQRTVEGLSVAGITYYVVSLLHLLLAGAGALPNLDLSKATAAAVPIVALGAWLLVRRARRRVTPR